uniref:Uncharacterized protein n=1 Tax=Neobodo designis TaxID=312471 RepID=A0A7S1QHL5_NEODS
MLASSDEEYAAMALAGVLNGDMDMLSHVLHVSSGAVATLAQRLTNSDAGTPVALVRCLNTMAVAAGPDERLWLIELGMPQAFVSACTARHVRPPPLPSASVYQYFAGFEDDGEATDMHA